MSIFCFEVNQKYANNWMRTTVIDWAQFGDCNACIVDWSHFAKFDYSTASSQNIKLVAKHVSEFVAFLIKNGMNIDDLSIAGHSLGAQIAGHVGSSFEGKIGTIYGVFIINNLAIQFILLSHLTL